MFTYREGHAHCQRLKVNHHSSQDVADVCDIGSCTEIEIEWEVRKLNINSVVSISDKITCAYTRYHVANGNLSYHIFILFGPLHLHVQVHAILLA